MIQHTELIAPYNYKLSKDTPLMHTSNIDGSKKQLKKAIRKAFTIKQGGVVQIVKRFIESNKTWYKAVVTDISGKKFIGYINSQSLIGQDIELC